MCIYIYICSITLRQQTGQQLWSFNRNCIVHCAVCKTVYWIYDKRQNVPYVQYIQYLQYVHYVQYVYYVQYAQYVHYVQCVSTMYRMQNITFVSWSHISCVLKPINPLTDNRKRDRQTSVRSAARSTDSVDIVSGSVPPVAQSVHACNFR